MGEVKNIMEEFKTIVKVVGEINPQMLEGFMEDMDNIIRAFLQYKDEMALIRKEFVSEFPRILIDISSYGGCTDCGSAMLDKMMEMQEMGIHIDTRCQGFAYSMAFILFIAGERRTGGRFSKYMNHGSSASAYGMVDKMKTDINFFARCDEQFDNLILKQTDMTEERLEKAKLKNDWIFYDEAIELGIVNSGFEGAEEDEKEFAEKLYHAFDVAIATFGKIAEVDEQEAMGIMHDILDSLRVEVDEEGNVLEGEEEEISEEEFLELLGSEGLQLSELLEDEEETDEELLDLLESEKLENESLEELLNDDEEE